LWSVWTVGVRISLGAWESPANAGFAAVWRPVPLSGDPCRPARWERGNTLLTGTPVGTIGPPDCAVSVHPDRGRGVVRWRDDGGQRARRFATEAEAIAALGVLVAALNGAVADQMLPLNPAAGVERLPLGHIERDWLRLHEIGPYLDACQPRLSTACGTARGLRHARQRGACAPLGRHRLPAPRPPRLPVRDPNGEGPTKGKRFRSVQVGPNLLDTLRDLRARRAELDATDLTRARVFATPVRRRKRERGRWASKPQDQPLEGDVIVWISAVAAGCRLRSSW
jgi:hypothetical protein